MKTDEDEAARLEQITKDVTVWAATDQGRRDAAGMGERARASAKPFRDSRMIRPEYLRTPVTR